MTRFLTVASAVLALAAAVPAVHAETAGQTVRVSYADLNLATISGRQALDQRVSRAVDKACGERPSSVSDLDGMHVFQSCQKAARSSVDGQIKIGSDGLAGGHLRRRDAGTLNGGPTRREPRSTPFRPAGRKGVRLCAAQDRPSRRARAR